jgi:hypothetical protein
LKPCKWSTVSNIVLSGCQKCKQTVILSTDKGAMTTLSTLCQRNILTGIFVFFWGGPHYPLILQLGRCACAVGLLGPVLVHNYDARYLVPSMLAIASKFLLSL